MANEIDHMATRAGDLAAKIVDHDARTEAAETKLAREREVNRAIIRAALSDLATIANELGTNPNFEEPESVSGDAVRAIEKMRKERDAALAFFDTERALREALEEQLRAAERERDVLEFCDGCGVRRGAHHEYCGEPAYGRQVDDDGRTMPDRCGSWTTPKEAVGEIARERAEAADRAAESDRQRNQACQRWAAAADELQAAREAWDGASRALTLRIAEVASERDGALARAEKAERERGPAITRADARELLQMSDLSTSDACYERVRAALREYAGSDFECHRLNPLDAALARIVGLNAQLRRDGERIAALEAQLAQAKVEGAREALERVEYELYARTAMHVPERMETIRILRKMAARLAGEEPKS